MWGYTKNSYLICKHVFYLNFKSGAFRENMEEGGQRVNWRAQTPIVSNTRSHIYRRQGAHKRSKQSKNLSDSDLNPVKQKYTSDFRLRAISAQPLRDSGQVLETVQASEYFT